MATNSTSRHEYQVLRSNFTLIHCFINKNLATQYDAFILTNKSNTEKNYKKLHRNKTRLLPNSYLYETSVLKQIQSMFILLRNTLCWVWDLVSWTSPQASIQQGKLHLGSPAHTVRPAGHNSTKRTAMKTSYKRSP